MRRYLLGRERLVAEVRWHLVWLVRPVLYVVAAAVVGTYLAIRVNTDSPLLDVAGFAFLASLLFLGWKVLEWRGERLVVTDRRLIMITGLLTRRVGVMPLRKVTDMTFERPLVGRLLGDHGWGTFVLESAGQDQAMHRIPYLPEPERLYGQVSHEIFGDRGPYSGGAGSPDPEDDLLIGSGGPPGGPGPVRPDSEDRPHDRSAHDRSAHDRSEGAESGGDAPLDEPGPRPGRSDTTEIPAVRDTTGGDRPAE